MKKLFSTILVLGLLLSGNAYADDISDFQIGGMSIGDSLLDYFSDKNIKKKSINWNNKNKTYKQFLSTKSYNLYDTVVFSYLGKDKNYIIQEIAGRKNIDIKSCIKLQLEIVKQIEKLIPSAKKNDLGTRNYRGDKSKKSKITIVNFNTGQGLIQVGCYDFSDKITKERKFIDGINVSIGSKQFMEWQKSGAF